MSGPVWWQDSRSQRHTRGRRRPSDTCGPTGWRPKNRHETERPIRCATVRAFVTGAGGFVGSWLVEHLRASGDEVVLTDREVDVTDSAVVREAVVAAEPEAIYHLAALTHV